MIRIFILVSLQMTWSRIWQRIRRLRNPRYLVGAIAGIAYFWLIFWRRSGGVLRKHPHFNEMMTGVLGLAVLVVLLIAWALPRDAGGLEFSEAEIAFLFPAPLRRRDLLLYKTIRAQPQALMSAVIFTVFGWVQGRFVGVWLAFSVLSLYFTMVALARARLRLLGVGFIARMLVVAGALMGLAVYLRSLLRGAVVKGAGGAARMVTDLISRPIPHALLFVPRIFVTAVLPAPWPQTLISWAALALAGVALYFVAAGINVSFEEASIERAQRRAQKVARQRRDLSGQRRVELRMRPLFPLRETGVPEIAITWKNVIALTRTSIGFVAILTLLYGGTLGMAIWSHEGTTYQAIGGLMMMMAAMLLFFGPQVFANDFRLDLGKSEVLKSYPISGERLVAAELAAPLMVISTFQLALLGTGALLLRLATPTKAFVRFVATPQFVICALLFAVPICAMQLVLRNALPLYFPGWAMQSKDDARGIVTAGQRIVVLAANIVTLALVLLPAALVFLPMLWISQHYLGGGPVGLAAATMPAIAVMVAEVWLGIKALGVRFENFDVWNELEVGA